MKFGLVQNSKICRCETSAANLEFSKFKDTANIEANSRETLVRIARKLRERRDNLVVVMRARTVVGEYFHRRIIAVLWKLG